MKKFLMSFAAVYYPHVLMAAITMLTAVGRWADVGVCHPDLMYNKIRCFRSSAVCASDNSLRSGIAYAIHSGVPSSFRFQGN